MAMEEYYVQEKKIDPILILLLFLIGWFLIGISSISFKRFAKNTSSTSENISVKFLFYLMRHKRFTTHCFFRVIK